jgi:hypothetical protein
MPFTRQPTQLTARAPRIRVPFYGVIDPMERTVYVNDPNNIAGMGALLDAIIARRLYGRPRHRPYSKPGQVWACRGMLSLV